MASRLSNELIRGILLIGLHVPDVMFRDVSPKSPFFRLSHQPTSGVLLVCKSWTVVATPLLYQVVILRSKTQAQALERTLRTRHDLGTFVRKLRVEGGLGSAIHSVLTRSPNITDLCLSLDLRSSDSVTGLVRSLDRINPVCLVIVDPRETEVNNTPLNQLISKLTSTLVKWTNLNEVYVSGMEDHIHRWYQITAALIEVKSLHTIIIPFPRCTEDTIQELKKCPSLKLIRIVDAEGMSEGGDTETSRYKAVRDCVDSDRRLRALVKFESPPPPRVFIPNIPVIDPAYVPMTHSSDEVRDLVWSRVLYFVFDIDVRTGDESITYKDLLSYSNRNNSRIPAVSKDFHRLSLPYIYGFLMFFNHKSLQKYTSTIHDNPSLGKHLRYLQILPSYLAFPNPDDLRECLRVIIKRAPNLTKLHAVPPPVKDAFRPMFESRLPVAIDTFRTLANTAGPRVLSILGMEIVGGPQETLCPSVLRQFESLRSLRCEVTAIFDLNIDNIFWKSLSALQSLQITYCSPSFLGVISTLHLPSLREFEIKYLNKPPAVTAFLKIHGPKITRLGICPKNHLVTSVFDLCPNMTCLKIYLSPNTDDRECFSQTAHARLTKIIFDRTECDDSGPPATESPEYISALKFSNFPALHEIQVPFLDWPVTEFEISRSKWPECSEFLASHNIKLTDSEGRTWRPRLKLSKA
ncbi:hypothetical protein BDZ94DRAFT_598825 [Collybia nuda]|uniref:Uncharacterized protein n=1 Tax=Collybia nuda TaxID=64659 RepID=A0A9P5Y5K6_9AGAR|nr:hypothetical protein BDZ94DRAFT_598825 [Collybia nuda]